MSKRYRQLLPIPPNDSSSSNSQPSGSSSTPRSPSDEPLKRQRIGTQQACNSCRKRKIRCDGRKPMCESCRRRGETEPCTYTENRSPGQMSKETEQILGLFEILKTAPEIQAIDILRVLRSHADLDTAVSIIQPRITKYIGGHVQSAEHARYMGLESELMARHSLAFPALQPLESHILKKLFSTGQTSATQDDENTPMTNSDPNPFQAHDPAQSPAPALSPCDKRLEELNIGFWTSVPIAADLAARVILLYLETDHPLLGSFDPTLFVDDLVHCRTNYCSKLLVSTLMYWGCMYSAVDPTVQSFVPQFCDEAEKRWSLEKATDSLVNLAATQLLGLAYLGNGKDHYVLTYVSEVHAMGARMRLFGVEQSVAISKAKQVSAELQSATSYAAWGTFNWIVLMALFYQQPGLSYPEHPPIVPIPGHKWYCSSEPSPETPQQTLQQTYMGDTFPILCRFWRIMHEVTLKYYRDQPFPREGLSSHITLSFAEYKYRELIAWAETLPPSMVRSEQSPHHVLVFHIWLHVAILCILRPFTVRARDSPKPLRLKTFFCKRSSPDAAYKASVNQLKRLVVAYRENYTCSSYTMLWHTALIHVANAILGDTKDPAWRFYLFFCVQTYGELRRSFRFAETIGRSILSMTLQRGDLSAEEARKLMVQFEENRLSSPSEDIRATFMADLNLAMTDPEEASVESLSDKFEDIALFREFTNAGDSSNDEPVDSDDNIWDTS
ncbi:nitrogen assimilation transcription factor nit-4 [Fusarium beomiforme]|uniref:Nitrogen assimilation transcription factor nit-4 n=1 Tax=Fusarium beomiforme TaxID=44412 RepID=A0A9P5ANH3_9HYPO|nr:nitrogen assimilation transcription factor nit-4 [Fusarium beomiforme]